MFTKLLDYKIYPYLRLSGLYLLISQEAYRHLGKPKYLEVFVDADKKQIKLFPTDDASQRKIVMIGEYSKCIRTRGLSKIVPVGYYVLSGDGVFAYDARLFKLKQPKSK